MLKRLTQCKQCGADMEIVRRTKTYCSEACRKKAARGNTNDEQNRWIVETLKSVGFVAKVWPAYSWDKAPAVFALMVPSQAALEELNVHGHAFTESDLERALKASGVETANAGERLKSEIKTFYQARKDRRFRGGYTPADNEENTH